ncbi:histidine phosphatase family protein [Stigmatella sp. ncwal1]|uniref:Histidine phosphatase family protein n=1 Tax=Stigmatella ashevillensis TaxID=2995309 RepID=A0ABT5DFB9_9BACT|nr:histidine phosphatase family protein [Stigmatella ashevillena]MDC0712264.1 histidine phosphatase family protein [Stigmatella ashevillena]
MPKQELPILLVRHAIAEDKHPLGDEARALTPEGRAAFRKHARKLAQLTPLMGILTSPLVRAVQTAELLAEAFGISRVEVHPALLPREHAHKRIVKLAREVGPGWALVGHNPGMARAGELALGEAPPGKMRKGAVLALQLDGKHFALSWFATPGRAVQRPRS